MDGTKNGHQKIMYGMVMEDHLSIAFIACPVD